MNYEVGLFMCDCNDCSSHVDIEWHGYQCKYRAWRNKLSAQQSVQADVCPTCGGSKGEYNKWNEWIPCPACNPTGIRR